MSALLLRSADVRRLLPVRDCIAAMEAVFCAHAREETVLPLRTVVPARGQGALYVMPAWTGAPSALAVKLITLFPGNAALGRETHQGVVVLFSEDGSVEALIEAGSVTAIRTAAVSAVATAALSRPDSSVLAILGSGVQARSHLEAMLAVRPIRHLRIWSRSAANARVFAHEAAKHDLEVDVPGNAARAARGADLICTVTGSPTPVLESDWVSSGTHINAVGASTASTRELDSETVARARVHVDSHEAAMAEAGDVLIPLSEGRIRADHVIGELGDVLLGRVAGRVSATDVTVFKSVGLAIEDAAAARLLANRAAADAAIERLALE
jgi:ornithine cyclodeaminase